MNTNKIIFRLSFEILFALFIIVGSFFIFTNNQTSKEVLAYNNENSKNLTLKEINPLQLSNIYPITNEDALSTYNKSKYQIINENNNKVNYRLIYRINNSQIKVEWFNYYLNFDNQETISNLGNLGPKNKEEYTDLILKQGTINANQKIEFEYLIWLNYNLGNEAQNKEFSANIVLETY